MKCLIVKVKDRKSFILSKISPTRFPNNSRNTHNLVGISTLPFYTTLFLYCLQ